MTMTDVIEIPCEDWRRVCTAPVLGAALQNLERGNVLLLPRLGFSLRSDELQVMMLEVGDDSKNVSLDPSRGILRGSSAAEHQQRILCGMMGRFGMLTLNLLTNLFPRYASDLQQAKISFRPIEIRDRRTSWRKDDTRLHVDSFPSSPTHGQRILRIFANVNPSGEARVWRLGNSFEEAAEYFLPSLARPMPGAAALLEFLHITKTRRSPYDHYMLQLHDRMKADMQYQSEVAQTVHEFLPSSTWIVFTDQVPHAAMSGQYALEQTYLLPVNSMREPSASPLAVLQRLTGRALT